MVHKVQGAILGPLSDAQPAVPETKEGLNLAIGKAHTDATPGASIFERDGTGIYGREGSHPLS
jgi:hypothetical protein